MPKFSSVMIPVLGLALLVSGCEGPEQKLGRGVNNMFEVARLGELRRSMEESAVLDNPDLEFTTGFFHGVNRTMERTAVGLYEVATFPVPNHSPKNYGPIFFSEDPIHTSTPVYPDTYKPNVFADQMTSPDTSLGFGGGDIVPIVPGSRFHIFDQ